MLRTCNSHHRRAEYARTLVRMTERAHDIPAIGYDARRTALDPRQNRLLAAIEASAYADLLPQLELVAMPERWVICEAGGMLEHVYFPVSGIVSFLFESASGTSVEVGLAGNEGLVGIHLLLGGSRPTSRSVVRNSGHGYRLRADVLKARFESCPAVRQPLLRYAQALIVQTTQMAACHCHHRLEQQFARLLLSTLDRLGANELALTQDTMASLLGVRRESITEAAGRLQTAGLIRYRRGRITVLNRPRLDALVCECYALIRDEFDLLFPRRDTTDQPATPIARRFHYTFASGAGVAFAGEGEAQPHRGASPV
jgi:CRP-like cAMP-binding protein